MKQTKVWTAKILALLVLIIVLEGCSSYLVSTERSLKSPSPFPATLQAAVTITPSQSTLLPKQNTLIPSPTSIQNPLPQLRPTSNVPTWTTTTNRSEANKIRVLLFEKSGGLWAGGPGGLTYWDTINGKATIYIDSYQSNSAHVDALAQTPDQAIWVGSYNRGLSRFDGGQWQTFTEAEGLPSPFISSLTVSQDGKLWVTTGDYRNGDKNVPGQFGQFDGQQWSSPSGGGGTLEIKAAPDGSIWGRSPVFGVIQFNGKEWNQNNRLSLSNIFALTIAPDGTVWTASRTGIYRYNHGGWQKIEAPWLGKTRTDVSSIAISSDGTVWFGFSFMPSDFPGYCGFTSNVVEEYGVYKFDGKIWTHFTSKDGLVDDKICAIAIDENGNAWFGSYDKGISRFDGKTWTSYVIP